MVVLNYSGEEINAKIVYYGPGLSGKTTNLEYIHEKMPVRSKGKLVSMKTRTDRTLFFDFLPLELGEIRGYRTRFLLYTVPGQVYYNATRKLVLKGVDGVVFVADSSREKLPENIESLRNLEDNLNEHGLSLDHLPWVIQYNKRDVSDAMPVSELHEQLNLLGVPAYEAAATQGAGVYDTFQGVAALLFEQLRAKLDSGDILPKTDAEAVAPGTAQDAVDTALREVRAQPSVPAQKRPARAPERAPQPKAIKPEPTPETIARASRPTPTPPVSEPAESRTAPTATITPPRPDAEAEVTPPRPGAEPRTDDAAASDAVHDDGFPEFIIDPMGRRLEPRSADPPAADREAALEPIAPDPSKRIEPVVLSVPVRVPRTALTRDSKIRVRLDIELVDE